MTKSQRGHIVQRKSTLPQLVIFAFATLGVIALVGALYTLSPDIFDALNDQDRQNDNRTWLTRRWTQTDRQPEEIAELVNDLRDNEIKAVYLQTGTWHGETGEYIELPYSAKFLSQFRELASDIPVYSWIAFSPEQLANPVDRNQIIIFSQASVRGQGFDGVHLQGRSIEDNDDSFLDLLRNIRDVIGDDAFLSVTIPPDRTPSDSDVPSSPEVADRLTWSQDYKSRVLLNTDEVVLMGHASSLEASDDYELWLAYQVAVYAELIDRLNIDMSYVVALPTYAAELGHDPEVENITSAVRGIQLGQDRARDAAIQIDGVGLYPWDQTEDEEFSLFRQEWLNS